MLGTISAIISNHTTELTPRATIKIFNQYCRIRITQLLPLITQFRKHQRILGQHKKRHIQSIAQKEHNAQGICIIGRMLLLLDYHQTPTQVLRKDYAHKPGSRELHQRIKQKAFIHWTSAESKNTEDILTMIQQSISEQTWYTSQQWDQVIHTEAAKGLFRGADPPQGIVNLRLPGLIKILSNAPIHIIKETIRSIIRNPTQEQSLTPQLMHQIAPYYLIEATATTTEISQPDNKYTADIIEYQNY